MRRSPAGPFLAATVAALVLAGCTGGDSAPSDDGTGPMSAFFERIGSSYEEEDQERQQREIEELVAACMAEQGFEYTPAEPMAWSAPDDEDLPDWDSKEYAEQYGYGATTSDELYGAPDEEYVDPNADYVASMSESEQAAFYEALYGVQPEVDPEADPEAEVEYNWEEGGCQGEASHTVYSEQNIWEDPTLEDMFDEMNESYENLADDPDLRKAQDAWASCMTEAGYDFASPDEASQSIFDEMNALWEAVTPADPEAVDPEATFEPDPAAMAELKEKELAIAVADFDCKEESGYSSAFEKANLALEKRLWDKYSDQLEAAAAKHTPAK